MTRVLGFLSLTLEIWLGAQFLALTPAQPSPGCCGYLGNDLVTDSFLCFSSSLKLTKIHFFKKKFKLLQLF